MPPSAPTVLQVIPELDAGGAELTTLEVAEAVIAAGGAAIIVTRGGRLVPKARNLGADVIERDVATKSPWALGSNATWMSRLIRDRGVALIHARSRAPAWSAERAARVTGISFVTTYHGAYAEKGRLKRAYNRVMARGDLVIANSAYIADLIRERYGTAPDRIRIINRGVDLAAFDARHFDDRADRVTDAPSDGIDSANRRTQIRAMLGLAHDDTRPLILHPARLTRWKGQPTVIAAARLLKERGQRNAVFVLAGDDQGRTAYSDELRSTIAAAGLERSVLMPGHISDMPALISLARAVLIASTDPEAFGRTSAEAQAMGVPVIATNIGAPRETVLAAPAVPEDTTTGWHVPPADPTALADALDELLGLSDDAYSALSSRAAAHARSTYSTTQLQRQTLAVYDTLLGTSLEVLFESQLR
ncbi:MAG: glycosyltransferase family 4 protein [Pseudomonadota bacterium]